MMRSMSYIWSVTLKNDPFCFYNLWTNNKLIITITYLYYDCTNECCVFNCLMKIYSISQNECFSPITKWYYFFYVHSCFICLIFFCCFTQFTEHFSTENMMKKLFSVEKKLSSFIVYFLPRLCTFFIYIGLIRWEIGEDS